MGIQVESVAERKCGPKGAPHCLTKQREGVVCFSLCAKPGFWCGGLTFWGYVGEILLSYYPLIHLGLRASGERCRDVSAVFWKVVEPFVEFPVLWKCHGEGKSAVTCFLPCYSEIL